MDKTLIHRRETVNLHQSLSWSCKLIGLWVFNRKSSKCIGAQLFSRLLKGWKTANCKNSEFHFDIMLKNPMSSLIRWTETNCKFVISMIGKFIFLLNFYDLSYPKHFVCCYNFTLRTFISFISFLWHFSVANLNIFSQTFWNLKLFNIEFWLTKLSM